MPETIDWASEFAALNEPFLEHYGVKGMRWGVRRDRIPTDVTVNARPGKLVKAKGGKNQPASDDAMRAARIRQQAKKSTVDSLSNKELQDLVTRMNLEAQYHRLKNDPERQALGLKVINAALQNGGGELAISGLTSAATKAGMASNPAVGAALAGASAVAKASRGSKKKKK